MEKNKKAKGEMMAEKTLYLKMNAKVKTREEVIRIGQLGKVYSTDSNLVNKVKTLKVYRFQKQDKKRCVIGILKVIEVINKEYPNCTIEVVGETETIVEQVDGKSPSNGLIGFKIAIVSLLCFFGTMYTIMAYHNEINLVEMFGQTYKMVTGQETDGFTALEASYSVGLSLGIIIFYNHIGKRRLTPDPSPVEVEMRTYEDDVNLTVVQTANREEKTIDVL